MLGLRMRSIDDVPSPKPSGSAPPPADPPALPDPPPMEVVVGPPGGSPPPGGRGPTAPWGRVPRSEEGSKPAGASSVLLPETQLKAAKKKEMYDAV